MALNILRVFAFLSVCLVLLVACAEKGYIEVPKANTNMAKVHASAVACSKDPQFDEVNLRTVSLDKVTVDGKTVVTMSASDVQNLVYNLKVIDDAGGKREAYTNYLRGCLEDIAELSVTIQDPPEI